MPPWWIWLFYASPTAWTIEAMFVSQLGDKVRCSTLSVSIPKIARNQVELAASPVAKVQRHYLSRLNVQPMHSTCATLSVPAALHTPSAGCVHGHHMH